MCTDLFLTLIPDTCFTVTPFKREFYNDLSTHFAALRWSRGALELLQLKGLTSLYLWLYRCPRLGAKASRSHGAVQDARNKTNEIKLCDLLVKCPKHFSTCPNAFLGDMASPHTDFSVSSSY